MTDEVKIPTYKDHLNKTFIEELSHKLWSTKGARFNASKRLLTQDDLSSKANGFLSAYLIIFGLLSVYQISSTPIVSDKTIAFGSTTLSILLLTFSQIEYAQDYKMRANSFHECALKIADLYNKLRIFKTLNNPTEQQTRVFCNSLSKKYQKVLSNYHNHDDIDYKIFRAEYSTYYGLGCWQVFWIKAVYYRRTKLVYHCLIILPPTLFILRLLLINNH